MMHRRIITCVISLALINVCHTPICAAPASFDAAYYAERYPDVVSVLGRDPEALYAHYEAYGQKEGRHQSREEAVDTLELMAEKQMFDPAYYAAEYPDVRRVCGVGKRALYIHYLNYGAREGRHKNPSEDNKAYDSLPYPTYVDVDIESQTISYFEKGFLTLRSPCVTGDKATGCDTPKGTWQVMSHEQDRWLNGPTWHDHADYWMCFTPDGCGFHDASWRSDSDFGCETYISNGSHGCVNLPHDAAERLFELIDIGTVVHVH